MIGREKGDKGGIPDDDLRHCVYDENASTYDHGYEEGYMDKRDTRSCISLQRTHGICEMGNELGQQAMEGVFVLW